MTIKPTFAQLFKFLRIKSGFKTISHFADTLAQEGLAYDNSLFSHWQRGSRTPTNRKLIITLIKIFAQNGSLFYENQANLFLQSAKKGNLTLEEKRTLPNLSSNQIPFAWKNKLEEFIISNEIEKKLKPKRTTNINKISRFNFILSSDTYSYFEKVSKEKHISKATFLRKLIEEHKNRNF